MNDFRFYLETPTRNLLGIIIYYNLDVMTDSNSVFDPSDASKPYFLPTFDIACKLYHEHTALPMLRYLVSMLLWFDSLYTV